MEISGIKKFLSSVPPWLFTIITLCAILWLTLAPKPLGENTPSLFPGADKIVHAIMFGFLTCMILLDSERKQGWKNLNLIFILSISILVSLFGFLIEIIQDNMGMGRGYETGDIIADTTGAFIFGICWIFLQHKWASK